MVLEKGVLMNTDDGCILVEYYHGGGFWRCRVWEDEYDDNDDVRTVREYSALLSDSDLFNRHGCCRQDINEMHRYFNELEDEEDGQNDANT